MGTKYAQRWPDVDDSTWTGETRKTACGDYEPGPHRAWSLKCTRPDGHPGWHVAAIPNGTILRRWSNYDKPKPAPVEPEPKPHISPLSRKILESLQRSSKTYVEIAEDIGCNRESVSPRMSLLRGLEMVRDSGHKRKGRKIWEAV